MFNQLMKRNRSLLAGAVVLAIAGTAGAEERVIDLEQHFGKVLSNGESQIAAQWEYQGQANFAPEGYDPVESWNQKLLDLELDGEIKEQPVADIDRPASAKAMRRWNAVNLSTGEHFVVELPAETATGLRRLAEQAGWNAGDLGSDKFAEPEGRQQFEDYSQKGWSNGSDTRTRRFNNTTYPYRAMGQIGGGSTSGCSGTLVGRRHVLTAAHCLYDIDTDQWTISGAFRPGREGTCNNAACEPYGEYTGIWYFTPSQFRAENSDWREYDYGMMVLNASPGTGWLGYVAAGQSTTRDYCDEVPFGPGVLGGSCINRGYPACGFAEAPFACQQGWAYQDQNACEIGSFYNTGDDGWASRFTTNCDLSRGHSGSAVFTNVWNGNTKVVLGVVSTQSCRTCSSNQEFVNGIRRVTPAVVDMISYFKAWLP